jgi:hypothetical protein
LRGSCITSHIRGKPASRTRLNRAPQNPPVQVTASRSTLLSFACGLCEVSITPRLRAMSEPFSVQNPTIRQMIVLFMTASILAAPFYHCVWLAKQQQTRVQRHGWNTVLDEIGREGAKRVAMSRLRHDFVEAFPGKSFLPPTLVDERCVVGIQWEGRTLLAEAAAAS